MVVRGRKTNRGQAGAGQPLKHTEGTLRTCPRPKTVRDERRADVECFRKSGNRFSDKKHEKVKA